MASVLFKYRFQTMAFVRRSTASSKEAVYTRTKLVYVHFMSIFLLCYPHHQVTSEWWCHGNPYEPDSAYVPTECNKNFFQLKIFEINGIRLYKDYKDSFKTIATSSTCTHTFHLQWIHCKIHCRIHRWPFLALYELPYDLRWARIARSVQRWARR